MKAVIKIINSRWFIGLVAAILLGLGIGVRFYHLTSLPPAPYWEEVALGYDAYSLGLTGKDHHGHPWPIAAFESFGDWKPSGYFYAAAISIKTFGLSVWATRFPAVLAGCLLVLLISLSGWLTHTFWRVGSKNFWLKNTAERFTAAARQRETASDNKRHFWFSWPRTWHCLPSGTAPLYRDCLAEK